MRILNQSALNTAILQKFTDPAGNYLRVFVYTKSTGDNRFNMGNSSYLFTFPHGSLTNPKLVFVRNKYRTDGYELPTVAMSLGNYVVHLQMRCTGEGKPVESGGALGELIAIFQMKINGNFTFEWRLKDSAIVTPTYQTIASEWEIINLVQLSKKVLK